MVDAQSTGKNMTDLVMERARYNLVIVEESIESAQALNQRLLNYFHMRTTTELCSLPKLTCESDAHAILVGLNAVSTDACAICKASDIPVILLVNHLDEFQLIEGFEAGAVEILPRSIVTEELISRILAQINIQERRMSEIPDRQADCSHSRYFQNQSEVRISKSKVLIVDDSIANIQMLNEILCDDYEIFFATSGMQAIEMAIDENPDLIILDVVMPQMNGYIVCEKLKSMQETKDIGIIFVTALNDVEDEAKGLKMGAIDYIVKPFNAHIVRARMHNHMELISHRKMLSNLSMTDGLTAIANRRQFDQIMDRELHRAIRQQESLTLILIDIDNFKKYNDFYGHVNGDECLKEIAAVLDDSRVRMTDFVARYGGEEFSIILPNTGVEGAKLMANKILESIQNLAIEHIKNDQFGVVTASLGVYCSVPEYNASADQIIKYADEALYKAKALGRNQIVFSDLQ